MGKPSQRAKNVLKKGATAIYDARVRRRGLPGDPTVIVGADCEGLEFAEFEGNNYVAPGCTFSGAIAIGRGTTLNSGSSLNGPLSIGRWTQVAQGVAMYASDHPMNGISMYTNHRLLNGAVESVAMKASPVTVGHGVWIGHGAILLKGVTVGNGAVVGAGAVVTKDVAPYSIVVGNPAKQIGERFDEKVQELIEDLAWWNYSLTDLKSIEGLFATQFSDSSSARRDIANAIAKIGAERR